jgi:hypothetical protein
MFRLLYKTIFRLQLKRCFWYTIGNVFFLNNQPDALIIPILFCYKIPHVSGREDARNMWNFILE